MKHLRELAKDFAQGKISQDAYRKQRTALIQGILSGNISVPDRDFLAPLPPPSDEDITSRGFEYDPLATTEIAVTKPGQKKPEKQFAVIATSRNRSDPQTVPGLAVRNTESLGHSFLYSRSRRCLYTRPAVIPTAWRKSLREHRHRNPAKPPAS